MSKAYFNIAILAVLCTLCFGTKAQSDSRLALVIGNANYDDGKLKNPVNDAVLIAETLRDLKFDVLLDTNISSKQEFIATIREFGTRRRDYDVGFVYYAGHGIQIGSENFLLPTKEVFESEFDVEDYGVSVQNILRYLQSASDKVNILVLDACRNNPFERKWAANRSLEGGNGLAKIAPPTGTLIAFSTEAGTTASDGSGENSVYCKSLASNMMEKGVSLDQLFRNVRSDVLQKTDGFQRPIESSQLTGDVFYFNPREIKSILSEVDKLIHEEKFDEAEGLVGFLINS